MRNRESSRSRSQHRREAAKALMRKIGSMEPYAGADPSQVEQRLRNMTYGATHPRVSELRIADALPGEPSGDPWMA